MSNFKRDDLDWMLMHKGVEFKFLSLMCNCLVGYAPSDLTFSSIPSHRSLHTAAHGGCPHGLNFQLQHTDFTVVATSVWKK